MWILKYQKIIALERDFQLSTIFFVYYFCWKISIQVYRGCGSFAPKVRPFSTSNQPPDPLNPWAHFDWKVSSDLPNVALRHCTTCIFWVVFVGCFVYWPTKGEAKNTIQQTKGKEKQKLMVFDVWMGRYVMLLDAVCWNCVGNHV